MRTPHRTFRHGQSGFNLLEVLVVLVILGILFGVGFPTFQYVTNSGRVSNPANELLATLQLARMEAIRRGQRTVVCRSQNSAAAAPTCTTAAGNWSGWLAFVDTNANGTFEAANDIRLRTNTVNPPTVVVASASVSGASSRVVFRPDGLARTAAGGLLAARIRICVPTTLPADNSRDVVMTAGSRTAVIRVNSAGACAAPANA
jgi:type IV fimbrial biogenesis protein FimT